jgi:hypothetical protein
MGGITTASVANCVAIGYQAFKGAASTSEDGTVAIGASALTALTTGASNTAIGYQALQSETTGGSNTIIGYEAAENIYAGDNNVAVGKDALKGTTFEDDTQGSDITSGTNITMDGANANILAGMGVSGTGLPAGAYVASVASSSADPQVFVVSSRTGTVTGGSTLTFYSRTSSSIAIGEDALTALTTGIGNTAVGYQAGNVLTTGAENTIIGYDCDVASDDNTNNIIIGNNLTGTDKDNAVFIGNDTNHIENDFNTDATWTYSSDIRQKTAIEDDKLGLGFINKLRTVTYKHKSPSEFPAEWTAYDADDKKPMGGDKIIHGMIAQEVKAALDKSDIDTFGGWSVGDDGRQRISLEKMVLPLIKAVQELSAEVEELKNK